jgi:hypothetical protein
MEAVAVKWRPWKFVVVINGRDGYSFYSPDDLTCSCHSLFSSLKFYSSNLMESGDISGGISYGNHYLTLF